VGMAVDVGAIMVPFFCGDYNIVLFDVARGRWPASGDGMGWDGMGWDGMGRRLFVIRP